MVSSIEVPSLALSLPDTVQVTVCSTPSPPATCAENGCVPPTETVAEEGVMVTPSILEVMVTVAVSDLEGF